MFQRNLIRVWIGIILLSGMFLMGQQTWPQCTTAAQCDDKNPCTDDSCVGGSCVNTNNTSPCDDGNVCTTGDTCSGGACSGTPVNCDDGNACTKDSCDSATGCVHTPVTCYDGNACTTDNCDPALPGCVFGTVSCDDGNVCTADACNPTIGCAHAPVNCDDGNACTNDTCDPATGCIHQCNATGPGDACCSNPACAGNSACILHRPIPDTGISLCYDNDSIIACPSSGQPFYGQDAQYTTNPMSFTDNLDETITDNVTRLMWQKQDDGTRRNWTDAGAYCESLSLAGYTDWRLPNEYELQGIVNYDIWFYPAIDWAYFPGTKSDWYWSSSTSAYDTSEAWGVFFEDGADLTLFKTGAVYVRCVRGESNTQSFTDNGNGTVTDNVTGLMWQQQDDGAGRTWEAALGYCEDLTLADRTDWRLPDIKELMSIVNNTRCLPAIDATYFPGAKSDWYWSSSPYLLDRAWLGHFSDGSTYDWNKLSTYYVRCVR